MERFGIRLSPEEVSNLIYQIEDYVLKPVYVSKDGVISFHPCEIGNEKVVIVYDWDLRIPKTVYRPNWFHKKSDYNWVPTKPNEKKTAKEIRHEDRIRTFVETPKFSARAKFLQENVRGVKI